MTHAARRSFCLIPAKDKTLLAYLSGRDDKRTCLFVISWPACERLQLLMPTQISRYFLLDATRHLMWMERTRTTLKGCSHSNTFTLAVCKVRVDSDGDFKSYGSLYVASNFEHYVCAYRTLFLDHLGHMCLPHCHVSSQNHLPQGNMLGTPSDRAATNKVRNETGCGGCDRGLLQ